MVVAVAAGSSLRDLPSSPSSLAGGDTNPLKSDPELAALLKRLPTIVKYKYFQRWKKSFLERLLPKIAVHEKSGIRVADDASDKVNDLLHQTAKQANKVVDMCCSSGKAPSVKATLALRELGTLLTLTTDKIMEWIPATARHEKAAGYTKFHLGAALIQQGFPQYITLRSMDDALHQIKTTTDAAVAGQLPLQAYTTQVQRFVDVMADLGLYEIMKKCLQFAVAPEVEESSDEEAMEITLQGETIDGNPHSMTIEVEPSETLETITTAVELDFGIPSNQLVLRHCGSNLMESCSMDGTLGKAGIQDGDTLQVGLRRIPLTVHCYGKEDNKEIPIHVTYLNTLQDIKTMVEGGSKIPASHQRLFRKSKPTKELIDNQRTVQDYGFVDNEHLQLEPKSVTLHIDVPELDKSFDLQFGLDDTSEDIKAKIAQKTGMDIPVFTTTIQKTKQDFPEQTTIRDMKLLEGDKLQVGLKKIPLIVHCYESDKEIPIHVTYLNTLQDIKTMVEGGSKIPASHQRLFRKSKPTKELIDNQRTVQDYGFVDNEHLQLEPKSVTLHIDVPELDKSFDLQFGLDDTSEDIKAKIAQKTGMDIPVFTTTIQKTKQDFPEQTTIRDMKLQDRDTLNVSLNKIPIVVKQKAGGATVTQLMVHPMLDTLGSIKDLIKDSSGVDPARQIIFHNKQRLDDDSETVHHMGLKPQSVLILDTGPVEITSSGEIYVSFRVRIKEEPNNREYKELAKVTQDFYAKLLKKKYAKSFQSIEVGCYKTRFEAGIPGAEYNVYVELDFRATFDSDEDTSSGAIPTRHSLCSFLVKADLSPYLGKVSKMPNKSFSKTYGVYTQQTYSH